MKACFFKLIDYVSKEICVLNRFLCDKLLLADQISSEYFDNFLPTFVEYSADTVTFPILT